MRVVQSSKLRPQQGAIALEIDTTDPPLRSSWHFNLQPARSTSRTAPDDEREATSSERRALHARLAGSTATIPPRDNPMWCSPPRRKRPSAGHRFP